MQFFLTFIMESNQCKFGRPSTHRKTLKGLEADIEHANCLVAGILRAVEEFLRQLESAVQVNQRREEDSKLESSKETYTREPVIVRDVLKLSFGLNWESMVLLLDVQAIDSFTLSSIRCSKFICALARGKLQTRIAYGLTEEREKWNIVSRISVVIGYGRNVFGEDVIRVFGDSGLTEEREKWNIVSRISIVIGYGRNGFGEDVIRAFGDSAIFQYTIQTRRECIRMSDGSFRYIKEVCYTLELILCLTLIQPDTPFKGHEDSRIEEETVKNVTRDS